MTELHRDIRREPEQLRHILDFTFGAGRAAVTEAARLLGTDRFGYITGIGSSWHASVAAGTILEAAGRPCRVIETSELLDTPIAPRSAAVVLSRSGRSYEIVAALPRLQAAGVPIVAVTNSPDSPLAKAAAVVLEVPGRPDHMVSVTMYSGVALVAGLLASCVMGGMTAALHAQLDAAIGMAGDSLDGWNEQLRAGQWLTPDAFVYFLGRQASLATCYEACLLWEEAGKAPASARTTSGFRHGSQEMVRPGVRAGICIQPEFQRSADLRLAAELQAAGAEVLLLGQGLPATAAGLVIELPPLPPGWQFLLEIVPAQLAAVRLAELRGVDSDTFRFCPYIVTEEAGLGGQ